ncbi:MAG: TonB-dependent receptor [Saprospiraceae bacterium]|nr:TonB-dependent receptor [Saprospiraceae bacterium]
MLRLLIVLSFLFLSIALSAQKYTLKGIVKDVENNNLIGAVAVLLNPVDSVMLGFAATETNGSFMIEDLAKGKYNLQITYIGYGTIQRLIELSGSERIMDLGIIKMNEEGKMLDAVTISAEYVPIKVTKDTLEFNADAFKTQPNAVVEDLLKRLPGVEVDADGVIKVQGEEVKSVTVDGKEFFGNDPKMATKNLPANAVKKVQVFDKKSKSSEFTGIDDGNDEKTINLELKEDKRNGYFGNVMAGYGTDNRYEGKTMVNRFSPKTQLSFLGSLNNLNNSGVNVSDFLSMTGSQGGGAMRAINANSGVPLTFGQNNVGDTESVTAGINLNQSLANKNKLSFSYYLTQTKTDLIQSGLTNSFLPSGALISNNQYNSFSEALNHNFNTTFDLRLDSTTELTLRGSLGLKDNDGTSGQIDTTRNAERIILNYNDQSKGSESNSNNYNFTLNIRKKLNKIGRTVTLDGSIGANESDNMNRLLSEVYGRELMLNNEISVFQDQNQFTDNNNYSFGATYTEPIGNQLFVILNGSRKNNKSDIIKDFLELNPDALTIPGVLNEELSRTFDNRFVYNTGGVNLRMTKETYTASAGVDFQNSNLQGLPSVGEEINKQFNNFLPKASLELDKLRIRMNYSTAVREPSMDQLQPVIDNTDPLKIYKGNPSLVPEYRHNMRISYNFFDQFNFRSLFANVRLGHTKNRITTSTILNPETSVRTQTPVNTKGESTLAGNINYSSPLNFMKAKFRTGINTSLTSGINLINGKETNIDRWNNGLNLTLENKSKKVFDASISGRWSYNSNIYKGNEAQNTNFINQTYETYLALFAGKGWTIDTRMEYYLYDQGSFDASTKIKLWQASISKGFMDNKLTAKLRIFDILNQNQGVSRSASDLDISETVSNTIGRYFMLNLTYTLNALGSPTTGNTPPHHVIMR